MESLEGPTAAAAAAAAVPYPPPECRDVSPVGSPDHGLDEAHAPPSDDDHHIDHDHAPAPEPEPERKRSAEAEAPKEEKAPEPEPMDVNEEEKEKKERKAQALKEKEAGNVAYKKKDFDTAIQHYTKAIELNDEDISYIMNRAATYLEMGKV